MVRATIFRVIKLSNAQRPSILWPYGGPGTTQPSAGRPAGGPLARNIWLNYEGRRPEFSQNGGYAVGFAEWLRESICHLTADFVMLACCRPGLSALLLDAYAFYTYLSIILQVVCYVTFSQFSKWLKISPLTKLKSNKNFHIGMTQIVLRSSWSYSRENGPLRSNTSTSSSHHAKMWGVDHAIFGIIRNAMSCSLTRWNVPIFWQADFVSYHFKSKSCFFINTCVYFHKTQSDRANRYHWTLPPLKNIVPYFICFASIIKAKEAFFNKTDEIISYNMYTVAMDTTTKPF